MMTHKEMIEVIAAHEHGATIECRARYLGLAKPPMTNWRTVDSPSWDFQTVEYRVAPPAKVKMWQWLWKNDSRTDGKIKLQISSVFYANEHEAYEGVIGRANGYSLIGPAKWTEIEVDAPQTNTPWRNERN